jgi:hypothetical protein
VVDDWHAISESFQTTISQKYEAYVSLPNGEKR